MPRHPRPSPAVSSIRGLRTPAPGLRGATFMGPPSANLHECGCRQLRRKSLTWVIRVDSIPLGSLPVSIGKLTCRCTWPRVQWSALLEKSRKQRGSQKYRASRNPVKAAQPALPVAPKARALTRSRRSGSGLPGAQGWDCPNTVNQLLVVIEPINDCVIAV
jgi:hypothetical protein